MQEDCCDLNKILLTWKIELIVQDGLFIRTVIYAFSRKKLTHLRVFIRLPEFIKEVSPPSYGELINVLNSFIPCYVQIKSLYFSAFSVSLSESYSGWETAGWKWLTGFNLYEKRVVAGYQAALISRFIFSRFMMMGTGSKSLMIQTITGWQTGKTESSYPTIFINVWNAFTDGPCRLGIYKYVLGLKKKKTG